MVMRWLHDRLTNLHVHWLRVPLRIAYKLCLITYKTLNDRGMSDYISNFCSRQKATILVEKSSTRPTVFCEVCGDCFFSIAGILNGSALPTMRRTHYRWRHLNWATSSKPIFSYTRITDKLCGSPAWKHTFTRGYTSSVGVQHGNTHSHKSFKFCGSPALTQ